MGERGQAPKEDGRGVANFNTHPVDEASEEKQSKGIGAQKAGVDTGELRIRPVNFVRKRRLEQRKKLTVGIDNRCGKKDDQAYPPPDMSAA